VAQRYARDAPRSASRHPRRRGAETVEALGATRRPATCIAMCHRKRSVAACQCWSGPGAGDIVLTTPGLAGWAIDAVSMDDWNGSSDQPSRCARLRAFTPRSSARPRPLRHWPRWPACSMCLDEQLQRHQAAVVSASETLQNELRVTHRRDRACPSFFQTQPGRSLRTPDRPLAQRMTGCCLVRRSNRRPDR